MARQKKYSNPEAGEFLDQYFAKQQAPTENLRLVSLHFVLKDKVWCLRLDGNNITLRTFIDNKQYALANVNEPRLTINCRFAMEIFAEKIASGVQERHSQDNEQPNRVFDEIWASADFTLLDRLVELLINAHAISVSQKKDAKC